MLPVQCALFCSIFPRSLPPLRIPENFYSYLLTLSAQHLSRLQANVFIIAQYSVLSLMLCNRAPEFFNLPLHILVTFFEFLAPSAPSDPPGRPNKPLAQILSSLSYGESAFCMHTPHSLRYACAAHFTGRSATQVDACHLPARLPILYVSASATFAVSMHEIFQVFKIQVVVINETKDISRT